MVMHVPPSSIGSFSNKKNASYLGYALGRRNAIKFNQFEVEVTYCNERSVLNFYFLYYSQAMNEIRS